jgi:hypothetical protein
MDADVQRADGQLFNARLPDELHRVLKRLAVEYQVKHGRQLNINREVVSAIFVALANELTEDECDRVAEFIQRL